MEEINFKINELEAKLEKLQLEVQWIKEQIIKLNRDIDKLTLTF